MNQFVQWAMANVLKQKFDTENSHVNKAYGTDHSTLPFGSTVTINNTETKSGLGTKLLMAAALAGGGAGLGAIGLNWLSPQSNPTPAIDVAPPVVTLPSAKQGPIEIEGELEWESTEDGGIRIKSIRAGNSSLAPAWNANDRGGKGG